MKIGVPWRVKGIRPDARETAREAARRAGMSVGEWLNTVIIETAEDEGVRLSRRGYDEDDDDQLFGVHERLDELTRHIEKLNHLALPEREPSEHAAAYVRPRHGPEAYAPPDYVPAPQQPAPPPEPQRDHLAEAIARLDRRLDDIANSIRTAPPAPAYAPPPYVPPPPPPITIHAPPDPWVPDLEQAMVDIVARQRALDAEPESAQPSPQRRAAPPQPAPVQASAQHAQPAPQPQPAPVPTQDLSGLEQHLRHITTQIEALRHQPQVEQGIAALREALSEIARSLLDAMPRRAIEALEAEVRSLADRLDQTRSAGVDGDTLASVERGLAEVRDTLRTLTPAENLEGFRQAVHSLAQKVDMLGATGPDMNAFQQLEEAIAALRGIVSHVASNEALAHLANEVRALSDKIDQVAIAAPAAQSNALEILDQRIAHIADALESRAQNGGNVPPQLEAVIHGLSEKIERLQHSPVDEAAFANLEARVAQLMERLDASGARFSQLEAIERGLAELLNQVESQRAAGASAAAPPMDGLQRDLVRTQTSLEAVHGTLGHVVDRLAMLEKDMRAQATPQPSQPPQPPQAAAPPMPHAPQLARPVPPALEPEPTRMASAAQTAAAIARANPKTVRAPIDPNLPPDHPLEPGAVMHRGRVAVSPADRIAASEAALGPAKPPVIPDPGSKTNFIAAARRAARAAATDPASADSGAAGPQDEAQQDEGLGKSLTKRMRQLFVGASVILIAGGALRLTTNLLDAPNAPPTTEVAQSEPGKLESAPSRELPAVSTASTQLPALEIAPASDVTGAVPPTQAQTPAPQIHYAPPASMDLPAASTNRTPPRADKLPAVIAGPALRQAAAAHNPAAEYEIGMRYAEGRGVTANSTEAVRWLELAARKGLAVAQFRLAGFYEKGIGVKKDVEAARRLYKSAAEQGNAKAMHNLAVLYAEGAAVKPDYRTAAQWFRMAADHGVADSQYNLAILYARGIGVDQNLTESYKWFALAANQGDDDAAKKRDEVGKRLDPPSLAAAKLAVRTFAPQAQPETAIEAKSPAGGWDAAASTTEPAPAKPKRSGPVRVGTR